MSKRRYNSRMTATQILIDKINAARDAGDTNVSELSRRTGIHRTQLSEILNGHQKTVTLDDAVSLAVAAGIELPELFSGLSVTREVSS